MLDKESRSLAATILTLNIIDKESLLQICLSLLFIEVYNTAWFVQAILNEVTCKRWLIDVCIARALLILKFISL